MNDFGFIYRTENIHNGKIYIGQTTKDEEAYLGSGSIIKKAIEKYGENSFTRQILEHCYSRDELNKREIFWIEKERLKLGINNVYNITFGDNYRDGFSHKLSIESRKRISLSKIGKPLSEEHKRSISKTISEKQKGEHHNKEWVRNQAKSIMKKVKVINIKTQEKLLFRSRKDCWTYFADLLKLKYETARYRTLKNKVPGFIFNLQFHQE
jgi:group I intron endonuclease